MTKDNQISYPVIWEYTIFCTDKELLKSALKSHFGALKYEFSDSKKSANYSSHHFKINVASQSERDKIFNILREIECVKFVL